MKSIILSLMLLTQANLTFGQMSLENTQQIFAPKVAWTTLEHDFGKIQQAKPVTYQFLFKNNGDIPLIISEVKSSCGCTAPEYSKEAIAPGKQGYIKVTYNAASLGAFNKTVTVISNASETPEVLTIKGEVITQ